MLKRFFLGVFVFSALVVLTGGTSHAATTSNLLPTSDGTYSQWTPSTGTTHYTTVDETTCNGTTDYVSETTLNDRDSYNVSLAVVPNGSTITQIDITPCASNNISAGSDSSAKVFYRLNGVNSADSAAYTLSGTTPVALTASSYTGLSTVKGSTTTLQSGVVLTGGTKGARLSRIATVITYTPLSAPSGLVTTTSSLSQIDLSWTDNSTNEDGFKIERSPNGSTSWTEVGTSSANVATFSDTGLTAQTTYYYRVRAYNTGGNSSYTTAVFSATTFDPPAAPTGLVASATAQTKINLTWTDNSTTENVYKIEQSPNGVDTWTVAVNRGANATSQTISNLSPNTTYYFRVYAVNDIGQSSYSTVESATTPTGLATVTTLAATVIGTNAATLNSTVNPNLGSTTVSYRYGTSNLACDQLPSVTGSLFIGEGSSDVTPNARVASSLLTATTYYFCVQAVNPTGTAYGSVLSFTTL